MTSLPPTSSCLTSVRGSLGAAAATMIASNGASSGRPRTSPASSTPDVAVSKTMKHLPSRCRELRHSLHSHHFPRQFSQNSGLIPTAGADLQHPVVPANLQLLGHNCDDSRLRDCLARSYSESNVFIRQVPLSRTDKPLSRNPGHGVQHPLVRYFTGQLSEESVPRSLDWHVSNVSPAKMQFT